MRLNRLDLIRYGRFMDAGITLPRHDDGSADVTVIFGPNEAGKSTTFNGFLDLLFGFRAGAHPYAFRFERKDLLIGAELDLPGRGAMALRRNGQRSNSLLDDQGRPVGEVILTAALHGLGRDAYEERFSLDDKGLREGGDRIAHAQGDLGQLLHAGISGLTGMAQTLDTLEARADAFHKKRGRATVLKTGTDRLKEIRRLLRDDILTSDRERDLARNRDRAAAAYDEAEAALQRANLRRVAVAAAQVWYEKSAEIERVSGVLETFPAGPDLPRGIAGRVAELVEEGARLSERIAQASREITRQTEIEAANPGDRGAAVLTAELTRLDELTIDGAPLLDRASTARADLGRRITEEAKIAAELQALAAQISGADADPAALVLRPEELEELSRAVQGCLGSATAAQMAADALKDARERLGEAPRAPQDLQALHQKFSTWQSVADISAAEAACEQARARLTSAVVGLPGRWSELIDAGLPSREALEEALRSHDALSAELRTARKTLADAEEKLVEARAEREALEAAPDAVDVARTEETRRQRDIAWSEHRRSLSGETAEAFESAMYADDGTRAHYLTGAEARQALRAAQRAEGLAAVRHERENNNVSALCRDMDHLDERCRRLALALGLQEDTPPQAFADRHQALLRAAEAAAELSTAEETFESRQARRDVARDALVDAAAAVGLDTSGDLPGLVHRTLALEETDRKLWTKWQEDRRALERLEEKAAQARQADQDARRRLDELTAPLPLADRAASALRDALPHLRSLQRHFERHQSLAGRIEALHNAIAELENGARRLAAGLTPQPSEEEISADPLQIINRARQQVSDALRAEERRAEAEGRREEAELVRFAAELRVKTVQEELSRCFEGQGGTDLMPRERIALLEERDALRAERGVAERAREEARAGADPVLFEEELSRLPDTARGEELTRALADAQEARDAARDASREAERLYRAAFDAADGSDLATEQATLLEELRSGARQAAVARLGVLAARGALKRLAAERRSSMLRDVEQAFVTMTAPAWSRVDVWSQAEGEKLVGVQPDGSTVPVDQMSTGTMGQLYFALRLAGYRSFARAPGPLPMILDDIMETFDDTRARAALTLCAEVGRSGQAILFTHHRHLVELARESIPGVGIVDMPA